MVCLAAKPLDQHSRHLLNVKTRSLGIANADRGPNLDFPVAFQEAFLKVWIRELAERSSDTYK